MTGWLHTWRRAVVACLGLLTTSATAVDYTIVYELGPASTAGARNGLVRVGGRFYGMEQNPARVFGVNIDGTGFSTLHNFPMGEGGINGVVPLSDSKLYGAAYDSGGGYLYRIDTNGANFEKILSFTNAIAGQEPSAQPLEGSDGNLYGIVTTGTIFGNGGIYRVEKDGSNPTTLISFTGTGNANPGDCSGSLSGRLIQVGADLFGMTPRGGTNDKGVIFKLTPPNTYSVLHHFQESDGANPNKALFLASDGRLYGVAPDGGSNDYGTIFGIDTDGTDFRILHRFGSFDGYDPSGSLIEGNDGRLYGSCFRGGAPLSNPSNEGLLYRIKKDGSAYSILHRFLNNKDTGVQPDGPLVQTPANTFYGTTAFGPSGGVIYRLDAAQQPPRVAGKKRVRVDGSRKRKTIRGRGRDDLEVARVLYRVRGKSKTRMAKGTRRWRIRLRLKKKRTVVKVFAFDFDENVSKRRRFVVLKK